MRAISGEVLYDSENELTPVNYPPVSFYIVGSVGRVLGSPLVAGRWISLLSLLLVSLGAALAVYRLTGKTDDAAFTGLFCMALFLLYATSYVGMNDPQLLGHVFQVIGLLLYIQNPSKHYKLFTIALFLCLGVFTKHNLVALRVIVKSGVLAIDSSGGLIDVCHFDSIVEFHSSNHLGQIIESS